MGITEELAQLAPGPALCARLAELTEAKASVPNLDTAAVLSACAQVTRWLRVMTLEWVLETATAGAALPDPCRRVPIDEAGVAQVRYALQMSQGRASRECGFAVWALDLAPALGEAMRAGGLDEAHAKVFVDTIEQLSEEARPVLVDRLLPTCMDMTLPQLEREVIAHAMSLDPAWAQRVEDDALARMNVLARRKLDGTVDVNGVNLPVEDGAEAIERLHHLARSAKADGDPRGIMVLRVTIYVGLLTGRYTVNEDAAILAYLKASRPDKDSPAHDGYGDGDGRTPPGSGGGRGPSGGRGPRKPAGKGEPTGGDGDTGDGGDGEGDGDDGSCGPDGEGNGPDPEGGEPDGEGSATSGTAARAGGPDDGSDAVVEGRGAGVGIEIKVKLSTLLGLDVHPGELTGYGPIRGEVVGEQVKARARGRWRWVLCDDSGYLIDAGTTRARPPGHARRDQRDMSITEFRLPLRLLKELLDNGGAGPWTTLVTDLAAQHALGHPPPDPYRRFPGADLRRLVQAAHPDCYGGYCHAPARLNEIDHVRPRSDGGLTVETNLRPGCKTDHRLKTKRGFHTRITGPHGIEWTTRAGAHYHFTERPLLADLPDPMPGLGPVEGTPIEVADPWRTDSCWEHLRPPPPPRPRRNRTYLEATDLDPPPPPPRRKSRPPQEYPDEPPF